MKNFVFIGFLSIVLVSCSITKEVKTYTNIKQDQSKSEYIYTEATKLKLLGKHDKSKEFFWQYLVHNPNSHGSYYQLAQIDYGLGNYKDAISSIEKALAIDSSNLWYHEFGIEIFRKTNQIDKAIKSQKRIVELDPGNDYAKYNLSLFYQYNRNVNGALGLLNELEDQSGIREEISFKKYELYLQAGMEDSAIHEIKVLIKNFPDRINYHGILAEYYLNAGRLNIAKQYYNQLFELDSNNLEGKISYGKYLISKKQVEEAKVLYSGIVQDTSITGEVKLRMLAEIVNNESAVLVFNEQTKALIGEYDALYANKKEVLSLYSDFYFRIRDLDKALEYLVMLSKIDGQNYFVWERILMIYNSKQNYKEVVYYATEALKYFPDKSNLYLVQGIAHYSAGELELGYNSLNKGYGINKERQLEYQFLFFMAECLVGLKRHVEADKLFEEIILKYPEDLPSRNNYAYYLSLRKENLKVAKKYSEFTIQKEPLNATYLDTYAWILYQMGKYKEAYQYISQAVTNGGSKNAEVLEHCGDICIANRKKEEAVYFYKRALELEPKNGAIQEKIRKYEN